MKTRLALFDLDHTLLPIDSDYAWGQFTIDLGWTDPIEFGRRNDEFYAQYQAGTLDIHAYVRFATEAFRLRGPAQAQSAHQRFMREVIEPAIRPKALDLIERHRSAGDRLLVITATNEFVTRPVVERLGVPEMIAVELERDANGWYSGEVKGVPSMREGKVQRLNQWLQSQGLSWDGIDATFYSDSTNDLPLLSLVQHPVATNPDARLREHARQHGWPILELFERE
ncbi:MAG: HAD family hydrolase [Alphaproteobacteria bacterium]|nr:HAD family hydrolase [Alphaproteobacteria bacterium]